MVPHDRNPLRLLIVYDGIYPEVTGGVEHRNAQLAAELRRRGLAVTLAGWTNADGGAERPFGVLSMGHRPGIYDEDGKRSLTAAFRFALATARLDIRPYDAVETANIPYLHVFPLALKALLHRKPLIVTWHEYWGRYWREYVGPTRWLPHAAIEWIAAQAGTVAVCVSELTAARLTRNRLRGQSLTILNGVPIDAIERHQSGTRDGPPLIYAGRLLKEKRVDLLLAAAALVVWDDSRGPLLTVIGDGPDADRVRGVAASLGLGGRVEFLGRLETPEMVWAALGRASIAVQPSSREGFGLFPVEAMACGLPVVYCRAAESAVGEQVRHGIEGVAVEPTPQALAAAIQRLLAAPGYWEELSKNASRRAGSFDWSASADRFEHLIERVCHRRAHAPASNRGD